MVDVTTVPTASAIGPRLHVVDGAAAHGRPGRGQVDGAAGAVLGADEAELPVPVAGGGRRRRAGRLGPAGRLGGEQCPATRRNVRVRRPARRPRPGRRPGGPAPRSATASVVRNTRASAPSASESRSDDLPGRGRLERADEQEQRLGRAGVADGGRQVVDRRPRRRRRACGRPPWPPGRGGWRRRAGRRRRRSSAGVGQGVGERRPRRGGRTASRRSAPPTASGAHVARRAPAVEELLGAARRRR